MFWRQCQRSTLEKKKQRKGPLEIEKSLLQCYSEEITDFLKKFFFSVENLKTANFNETILRLSADTLALILVKTTDRNLL